MNNQSNLRIEKTFSKINASTQYPLGYFYTIERRFKQEEK